MLFVLAVHAALPVTVRSEPVFEEFFHVAVIGSKDRALKKARVFRRQIIIFSVVQNSMLASFLIRYDNRHRM